MAKQSKQMTLADLGEWGILGRLLPSLTVGPGVTLGPGDDCAIVAGAGRQFLFTTDALVDGVHFSRRWMTAQQIGRKAYLVNASDIAAMGGQPRFCVVSIGAPAAFAARELAAIERGIAASAAQSGALVVGGNLTRAADLFVSVALLGDPPRQPLRRSGARPGDLLYVTGSLGEAALGLRLLQRDSQARGAAVHRFREPRPRLTAGALLARSRVASAMIDVSDGLLQDLSHLCKASGVGAQIELARLPSTPRVRREGLALTLSGGEDYELLCAVPARHQTRVERLKFRLGCRFTCIGRCRPARHGIEVVDDKGQCLPVGAMGFDHFARGSRV